MHYSSNSQLLLATLFASAYASPFPNPHSAKLDDTTTHYTKAHVNRTGIKNGEAAYHRMLDRYGAKSAVDTQPATTPGKGKATTGGGSGAGRVTASPEINNSAYLCPVTIGGQTFNLNLDTGSADLWVFNTALPASAKSNRPVYDPSQSKTYQTVEGAKFDVSYGDGSQTYGTVGVDTVEVGGVTVMGQALELPTAVSSSFTRDLNSDGILGLGFQSTNSIKPEAQPTFFENAMSSLKAPVFTANLKADTAGNYQFGVIDHTAFSGNLHYTPIDNSGGLWQFQTKAGASPGIADTGSSLLLLDDDIVRTYWAPVPGHTSDDQGILFPCGEKLPDLQIELGPGYKATISGNLINYANATAKEGYCFGGIQSNRGQGLNIFGDIMFASQFVVFDAGNKQIGFAPHAA